MASNRKNNIEGVNKKMRGNKKGGNEWWQVFVKKDGCSFGSR